MIQRITYRATVVGVLASVPVVLTGNVIAASQTTNYTYDELGRLTYVEDSKNGNRDYDYDKAGNRLWVSVGSTSDAASQTPPPVPAVPTGLDKNYEANCSWRATWNLVSGAATYRLRNTQNQTVTITPTPSATVTINGNVLRVSLGCPYNQPEMNEPDSLEACNSYGCSAAANF